MPNPIASRNEAEWNAHLTARGARWQELSDRALRCRKDQREALKSVFSETGISPANLEAITAEYATHLDAQSQKPAPALADFLISRKYLDGAGFANLGPTWQQVPQLSAACSAIWSEMFMALDRRIDGDPKALLASQVIAGRKLRQVQENSQLSLADSFLSAADETAVLYDRESDKEDYSILLDLAVKWPAQPPSPEQSSPALSEGQSSASAPPPAPATGEAKPVQVMLELLLFLHLPTQREAAALDAFWSRDPAQLLEFRDLYAGSAAESLASASPPRERPSPWWHFKWLLKRWFRKSDQIENRPAGPADAADGGAWSLPPPRLHKVWQEPALEDVPSSKSAGPMWRSLYETRARAVRDAEALDQTEAALTLRVDGVGGTLAGYRQGYGRIPEPQVSVPDGLAVNMNRRRVEVAPSVERVLGEAARCAAQLNSVLAKSMTAGNQVTRA